MISFFAILVVRHVRPDRPRVSSSCDHHILLLVSKLAFPRLSSHVRIASSKLKRPSSLKSMEGGSHGPCFINAHPFRAPNRHVALPGIERHLEFLDRYRSRGPSLSGRCLLVPASPVYYRSISAKRVWCAQHDSYVCSWRSPVDDLFRV